MASLQARAHAVTKWFPKLTHYWTLVPLLNWNAILNFTCLILQVEGDYRATAVYPPTSHKEYDGVPEGSDKFCRSSFSKLHRSSTLLEGTSKFAPEVFHLNEFNEKFSHDINSDTVSIVKCQALTAPNTRWHHASVLKNSVGNTYVFLKTGMCVFEPVVNIALEAISERDTCVPMDVKTLNNNWRAKCESLTSEN